MWGGVNDLLSSVDAALFGRVTYQDFERFWPVVPDNPASPKNEFDFSRWIDEAREAPRCAGLDPSALLRAGSRGARPHTYLACSRAQERAGEAGGAAAAVDAEFTAGEGADVESGLAKTVVSPAILFDGE